MSTTGGTSHSQAFTESGTYYFRASDASGNKITVSTEVVFTAPAVQQKSLSGGSMAGGSLR